MKQNEAAKEAKDMNIKAVTECLRYDFTKEEFADEARKLAQANQELARFEDRRKQVTADLAATLKEKQQAVSECSRRVSNGYDYRDVLCELRYNDPEAGKKTLVRLDTGEIVSTRFMDGSEMQQTLPLTENTEAVHSEADDNNR